MSRLQLALERAATSLTTAGASWALVGGLAVSARTEPRFTRDVDVAVAVADDAQAELLLRSLQDEGHVVSAIVEQDAATRLATARLLPPGEDAAGVVIDLLFASSGIEPELVSEAELIPVMRDLAVPVARVGHLIALKLLADDPARPLDRADLLALARVADALEIDRARRAVRMIAERGYARGRDLEAGLDALIA